MDMLSHLTLGLGAPSQDPLVPEDLQGLLTWGVVLMVAALVLGAAVALIRRKCLQSRSPENRGAGFEPEELESLHRAGRLSDGEYRTLRRATLGLDRAVTKKDNSASSAAPAPDDVNSENSEVGLCADADKEQP